VRDYILEIDSPLFEQKSALPKWKSEQCRTQRKAEQNVITSIVSPQVKTKRHQPVIKILLNKLTKCWQYIYPSGHIDSGCNRCGTSDMFSCWPEFTEYKPCNQWADCWWSIAIIWSKSQATYLSPNGT